MSIEELSRIQSTKINGKETIVLYGYQKDGTTLIKQYDTSFKNFLFVPEQNQKKLLQAYGENLTQQKNVSYKPYDFFIKKQKLKKYYTKSSTFKIPYQLKSLTYQQDYSIQSKYLNSKKLEFGRKRHVVLYDIQTRYDEINTNDNMPELAKAPITSIVLYSTFTKEYYVVSWHPEHTKNYDEFFYKKEILEDNMINYYLCKNEFDLLQTFIVIMDQLKPDIISGWFSHGYDLPYIIKRLDKELGNKALISPLRNLWMAEKRQMEDYYKINIDGLDSVDMMEVVQGFNYNLQNNRLDTASQVILGDNFTKLKSVTWRDWQDDYDGFLKYAIRDVQILVRLQKKLNCFEYLIQMQMLTGITKLNDIMSVTKLIDSVLIKKFWDEFLFPNVKHQQKQAYGGALVSQPQMPGVHKKVAVLDYASLYPTTDMVFNISPETFICSQKQLQEIGLDLQETKQNLLNNGLKIIDTGYQDNKQFQLIGKRYLFLSHASHIGVIPRLIRELYLLRKHYQKQTKKYNPGTDDYIVNHNKQYAIKIILNSIYGALGFAYFRLYVPECADTITFFGRKSLMFGKQKMQNRYGYKVLYWDTDSVSQDSLIRFKEKNNGNNNLLSIKQLFDFYGKNNTVRENKYYAELPDIQIQFYDQSTKDIKFGEVKYIYKHLVDKMMFQVKLQNNKTVEITAEHPLMVLRDNKLIQSTIDQLQQSDMCITLEGNSKIQQVTPLQRYARWVYDICMVDTPHTFFANGVLVHNSNHILLGDKDQTQLRKDLDQYNDLIKDFYKTNYNSDLPDDYWFYNFEHEKTLQYIYYGDSKKRYYSIYLEKNKQGNIVQKKYVHGLNIIRKDTPKYVKEKLDNYCQRIVKGNFNYEMLQQLYDEIKTQPLENIVIHQRISKPMSQYVKTVPQTVKATMFANQIYGLRLKHSDILYLMYVINYMENHKKHKQRCNCVMLRKQDLYKLQQTQKAVIDYNQYFEKQILQPLRQFYKVKQVQDAINRWSYEHQECYKTNTKGQWVYKKQYYDQKTDSLKI